MPVLLLLPAAAAALDALEKEAGQWRAQRQEVPTDKKKEGLAQGVKEVGLDAFWFEPCAVGQSHCNELQGGRSRRKT